MQIAKVKRQRSQRKRMKKKQRIKNETEYWW